MTMINFTNRTTYYISAVTTDMRKGYEGLASVWCGPYILFKGLPQSKGTAL